jgi:hypothetical protein
MCTGLRMFIPDFRESLFPKARCKLDESRPNPPMNIRDFVINKFAHQNLRIFANGARCSKDFPAFRVSPPTASNGFPHDRVREARYWPTCGLEYHSVTLHERDSFGRAHFFLIPLNRPAGTRRIACRSNKSTRWLPRSSQPEARHRGDVGCWFQLRRGRHAF